MMRGEPYALRVGCLSVASSVSRLRSCRCFQVSPLAAWGERWEDPGVIHLGPIMLLRTIGPAHQDPPTRSPEEKWARWQVYARLLPFLQVRQDRDQIAYLGHPVFGFMPNWFYGRLYYGSWYVGGSIPWYRLTALEPGSSCWGRELYLKDDDARSTYYETAEEKQARTARFWQDVDRVTCQIRQRAWREMIAQARARRVRETLQALRMVLGATWWLNRDRLAPAAGGDWLRRLDQMLAGDEALGRGGAE